MFLSCYHVLVCFLLGIVVPIVRKRHPGKFFFIRNLGLGITTQQCKHKNFCTIFSLPLKQREFSLSGLPRQANMEEKANKSNCLLHLVRLLACLNFCGSNILTTSTSACQPSCGSQLLWKPHQRLLWVLLRHLHMLRHSSVDWLVGWSTSSSAPSRSALKMCSFSFVMEHKWKSK